MTVASSAGIIAGMVTRGAQYGFIFGGGGRRDREGGMGTGAALMLALVVSLVVYAVSFVLTRMLSRYRELCADRSGALLTQQPGALASALVKISGEMSVLPQKDLREVGAMNAFFIAPAVKGVSMKTLTSTHPSLEQRLQQLSEVAAELGRPFDGGFTRPSEG
jgi:heat shock protein HtpX